MALALKDDDQVIQRYKDEHAHAWPEVLRALHGVGVTDMRIFLLGRRLFMYMEADDGFDMARDFARIEEDPIYHRWNTLMATMQEKVPEAKNDEWWALMEPVFDLRASLNGLA
jgi:L-rhamnose mutarotase